MRIEHLQYLVALSKFGSIKKTAANLYISQQGLSKAIQTLEKDIGLSILNHTGNKLYFTAEGEEILKKAEDILIEYNKLLSIVNFCSPTLAKDIEITIYATPFFVFSIFPQVLHQFRIKYPNISVSVIEICPSELNYKICGVPNAVGLLNITEYDFDPQFFRENNLLFDKLIEGEFLALVDKNSPLSQKAFISVEELAKYNLALLDFEQINSVYEYLFRLINKPNIVLKTSNQYLYQSTISQGLAIGFTTTFNQTFKNDSLICIPIKPSVTFFVGCVSWAEQSNENIKLFSNIMKKEILTKIDKGHWN